MPQLSAASQPVPAPSHTPEHRPQADLPSWAVPRRALRCPTAPPRRDVAPRGAETGVRVPLAFVPRGAEEPEHALTAHEARNAEHAAREAARLVSLAVAEALRGQRTVQQLGHHLDLECYRKVERRVRWEREARTMARAAADPGAFRVLSCHVQSVGERACECTCTLQSPQRVRALCFRLELHRGRWRCVEIEIG